MSASSTHTAPLLAVWRTTSRAWWAERFGRKPKLTGEKSASKMGSKTIFAAAITTRSRTVGTVASYCLLLAWCIGFGDCRLGLRWALHRNKPTLPPSLLL
ncbi:MAG: hypothetical protein ACRDYB_14740, partial [Acidimicrobiales bacterium]